MHHRLRLALGGRAPRAFKSAYLKLREIDGLQRAFPDFLIIGAQKAGTTSLFNYLCMHPQIVGSVPKEIFYFCSHPEKGERWYRRHFPSSKVLRKRQAICGEATPISLYAPEAPARAVALIPNARIIAILREPAARAVSHYHHQVRFGRESRPVDEVFSENNICAWKRGECPDETARFYFKWSDYATGLRRWLGHYPRQQLLVLEAEEMFADPQSVVDQTCAFLQVEPHRLPSLEAFNAGAPKSSCPQGFAELVQAFGRENRELHELGYEMSWTSASSREAADLH